MAVILTVDAAAWRTRIGELVHAHAAVHVGVLPVVKGNGYGFGRARLVGEVDRLGLGTYAVGTAFELDADADAGDRGPTVPVVLTPPAGADDAARLARHPRAVATIGSLHHLQVLHRGGRHGAVLVKLASSMHRYGVAAADCEALVHAVEASGDTIAGYAVHLPLVGAVADADRPSPNAAEAEAWLRQLPDGATAQFSHLSIDELAALAASRPGVRIVHRLGTALWHGATKDGLHLGAEVVEVRPCRAGDTAGYRATRVERNGHLVMVGAGTAHGVQPLDRGLSPYHFARRRLALVEPPHMHTSMVFVPDGDPCPQPGDLVDVQRPLTQTFVDVVRW